MAAMKRSKSTQSIDGKGAKKKPVRNESQIKKGADSHTSTGRSSVKTPPKSQVSSGTSLESPEVAQEAVTPEVTHAPVQSPSRERSSRDPGVTDSDGRTAGSGIDAMQIMKQANADKSAAQPEKEKLTKHVSAAQAITRAVVRDHPVAAAPPPKKPVTPKRKPAGRSTQAPDTPQEPKEPIGGIGAEGLPPPIVDSRDVEALLNADHPNPFSFLGMHPTATHGVLTVRAFLPDAIAVDVLDVASGKPLLHLDRVHDEGLFVGEFRGRGETFPYRLRITTPDGEKDVEDPYRFPPLLSDADARKLSKSDHLSSYRCLGAHAVEIEGVKGVAFSVWAPNASHVAVVGDFNEWDGRRHSMRLRHECGVWEIFLPGLRSGNLYKYEIKHAPGTKPLVKSDPYAFYSERPPGLASVVQGDRKYRWGDSAWIKQRAIKQDSSAPLSFYEIHLGSWRRKPEEDNRWLTYRELADELVDYAKDLGFSHLALWPVSEHTFDDTVGYLPSALYAPTSRYGTPDDFRYLVDACHRAGIGVVVDWVPNFLSAEPQGLALFDGTALYEDPNHHHARDPDWDMPLYNLGSPAVVNYLLSNALYWLDEFHLDGLRVDSLAKLLYLDYGRGEGEWTPNKDGGNDNLEALDFVRRLNQLVREKFPGVLTIAEDSSLRQGITRSVQDGGLGFSLRWNSAWTYDTLRYLGRHPVHRKYYHHELVNPLSFAFDENFVVPVSHDHVSIGQGAMASKIPGDRWQKFATLRAWLGLMYALPGKKLMFMGTEFAQDREWNSTISLDWHLLQDAMHLGMQRLVRDFNRLVRETPALHELDADANGFEWIPVMRIAALSRSPVTGKTAGR